MTHAGEKKISFGTLLSHCVQRHRKLNKMVTKPKFVSSPIQLTEIFVRSDMEISGPKASRFLSIHKRSASSCCRRMQQRDYSERNHKDWYTSRQLKPRKIERIWAPQTSYIYNIYLEFKYVFLQLFIGKAVRHRGL